MFSKSKTGCTLSITGNCQDCPHWVPYQESNVQTGEIKTNQACRLDLLLQNSFLLVQRTTGTQAATEKLRDNVMQGNATMLTVLSKRAVLENFNG